MRPVRGSYLPGFGPLWATYSPSSAKPPAREHEPTPPPPEDHQQSFSPSSSRRTSVPKPRLDDQGSVSPPETPPERDEAEDLRGLFEELGWMNRREGDFEAFVSASAEDLQTLAHMSMEREQLAQAIKEAVQTTRSPSEPNPSATTTMNYGASTNTLARQMQPDIVVESEGEGDEEQVPAADTESARRCRPSFIEQHELDLIPFLLLPPTADNQVRLSIEAEQKRAAVLHSSVQKQTATAYGRSVRSYIEFCEKEDIPPAERFPAQAKVVEAFLASFAGIRRASTVSAYSGGLKFWHAIHSLSPPLQDGMWRRIMRGLVAQQPPAKNLRPPATYRDLLVIREALDLEEPEDACLWAAATCALFTMARPGDVTLENRTTTVDPKKHFTGASCKIIDESNDFPACIEMSLPFDKAEGYKGETLIIVGQKIDPRICPLEAMRNHLRINDPGPQDFLFASRTRNPSTWGEGLYPLTGDWFRNRINRILTDANRSPLNGHSWRIGGATFYLLAGVHPDFIRVIGRWKSDAFYRYWRKIKAIAAKYLTDAALVDAEEHMPNPERV